MPEFFSRFRFATALVAGFAALSLGPAQATVTIEFFFEDGNLANGSIAVLVADVNGDGFLAPTDPAFLGTVVEKGQTLGGGDDLIIYLFQAENGGHWQGSAGIIETIEHFDYASEGITEGTPLALYGFPDFTQPGEVVFLGDAVFQYRSDNSGASGGDIPFVAPPDSGVYALAAVTANVGGPFDPSNPASGETYELVSAGVDNSGGGGGGTPDDHGNTRGEATPLTAGQPRNGGLTAGDIDFFSFALNGLARVVVYTTGTTDTEGTIFRPDGSILNDPGADGDAGEGANFKFDKILDLTDTLDLAVRGKNDNQDGSYSVVVEVTPLQDQLPDLMIGKSPARLLGGDQYSGTGGGQKIRHVSKKRRKVKFYFTVQNDAGRADAIVVKGTRKNRLFKATYVSTSGAGNVTAAMAGAGYTANLDPFAEESFLLTVKPSKKAIRKRKVFVIDAATPRDRGLAEVKAK